MADEEGGVDKPIDPEQQNPTEEDLPLTQIRCRVFKFQEQQNPTEEDAPQVQTRCRVLKIQEKQNLNEEDAPQAQTSTNAPVADPPLKSGEKPKKSKTRYSPITIHFIYNEWPMLTLVQHIEKLKYDEILSIARDILNKLRDRLLKSPPLHLVDSESEFYPKIFEVWEDSRFAAGVQLTIEEVPGMLEAYFLGFSKDDSPTDRLACMESDTALKTRLQKITSETDTSTIIRLFLSILVAHWTDHGVLMSLDGKMGEPHFKKQFDQINRIEARALANKERNVQAKCFSFNMDHPGDIEELRKKLTEKHGGRNQDVEAMVTRIQSQLELLLDVNQKYCGYDGGKVNILLRGYDGWYNVQSIRKYVDVEIVSKSTV